MKRILWSLCIASFGVAGSLSAQTTPEVKLTFDLEKFKQSPFYTEQTTSAQIVIRMMGVPAGAQTSATDKAEKRLADLLAPGSGAQAATFASEPVAWKGSPAVENVAIALKPIAAAPVRLPLPAIKEVKPRPAPEGTPLVAYRDQPQKPKDVELPTKPLIKLPSLDVHTPLPIPILALPNKDRASLGDPALSASLDATLKKIAPTRDRPVPFSALNLPDPFENARYGQLRNPPEENAMPPVIPNIKPTAK